MKTIKRTAIALFLAGLSSLAFAGPGPQYWQTLRDEAPFKRLKAGDKVAYDCNHTMVTYVNDQGEECACIAKVPDSK